MIVTAFNNHGIRNDIGAGTSFGLARCPVMRTTVKILCICGVILLMFAPLVYSSLRGAAAPIQASLSSERRIVRWEPKMREPFCRARYRFKAQMDRQKGSPLCHATQSLGPTEILARY